MKKRILAVVLLCVMLMGLMPTGWAADYEAFPENRVLTAATTSVVLQKTPEANASALSKVATIFGTRGKTFTALGESGDFYYVSFNGYEGFAPKSAFEAARRVWSAFPFAAQSLDGTINMREAASSNAAVVQKFTKVKGEIFNILAEEDDWYFAEYEGVQGYVRKVDFSCFTGDMSSYTFTPYAELTKGDADIWGHVQVENTFIDYPIYSNALNSGGTDYYYNKDYYSLFMLSAEDAPIAVLMGHNNRRRAGTDTSMLHDLHHLQNVYLGIATCEYCGAKVEGTGTDIGISYNGCDSWTLCGFFELTKSNIASDAIRADIKNYAALNSGFTGKAKQAWIDQQLLLAYQYGLLLDSDITSDDKVMIIITCSDKTGNDDQSFYLLLRGNE